MAALEAALMRNGVTKKDMQTSGLDIYDNTNNQGTGHRIHRQDTLNVTMHKVQRAGAAIDAAARAAGNGVQLNGVTFTITNDSSLLRAARIRAMDNARLAAGQLAKAGDTHVTSIVKITDNENQSSGIYYPAVQLGVTARRRADSKPAASRSTCKSRSSTRSAARRQTSRRPGLRLRSRSPDRRGR